jgi:hypothetical protein
VTPQTLIPTALLLGIFVVLAGMYGAFYSLAIVFEDQRLRSAGYFSYVLHFAVMLVIVAATPLGMWWKVMIASSSVAYLTIPAITWRYLTRIHQQREVLHDSESARRSDGIVAGLSRRT